MAPRKSTPAKTSDPDALLATYRAKRDFTKTKEPSGTEKGKAGKVQPDRIFMIQKHAATRLHYDFRLEMDGVLKSWAVTRGPSLNPADKRLAVQTEDHPLAYATFEGTIPEKEYGGGTVMLWDRGSWEPLGDAEEEMRKGHLRFRLHGERLSGEWHLVRIHGHRKGDGKRNNWLLIKSDDEAAKAKNGDKILEEHRVGIGSGRTMEEIAANASAQSGKTKSTSQPKPLSGPARAKIRSSELPAFIPYQLATLVDAPPQGKNWIHEIKFDGYRLQARIEGGDITLLTRSGQDWTHKFGPITLALSKLKTDGIIDGEVVAIGANDTMSFAALQQALSDNKPDTLCFYAFDLLHAGGEDLTSLPLRERKTRLRALIPARQSRIRYSEDFDQAGADVLEHACQINLEGIISKRADAPYRSGHNGDWLKSKCLHEQEFVIGGFTEQPKHPGNLGALLVGYYEDGTLTFAGKVGTGFTAEESRDLLKRFNKLERKASPFQSVPTLSRRGAKWLEPNLVAQIRFGEWTTDHILRHPAYLALREDKPAEEVIREQAKKTSHATREQQSKGPKPSKKTSKAGFVLNGVTLTHPDKKLYAADGITKQQLAEYYNQVAPLMLPHIAGRPISLLRCPNGQGSTCFFQRHVGEGAPPQLKQVVLDKGEEPFVMIDDAAGLTALVQLGVLEVHTWGSNAKTSRKPDRITFDFDPHEDVPFTAVKKAAKETKIMLEKLGLRSFLKTTGGKGLHVVVPFTPGPDWDHVRNFSEALAQLLSDSDPGKYTLSNRKDARVGKIYIDYLRNGEGASAIAPYSTRARPGAPVACPIAWEELTRLKSGADYTLKNILVKLSKRKNDPWAEMTGLSQKLPR